MNELEKNNINLFGERGKQWIQSLPEITESLSKKWQLTDIVPVENMSWNYVAKAHSKKHGPVCIKVSVDENLISTDIAVIVNGFKNSGWQIKPASVFEQYLDDQEQDKRICLVAFVGEKFAGYVTLKWQSNYKNFADDYSGSQNSDHLASKIR